MNARILYAHEWDRIEQADLKALLKYASEDSGVAVVEKDGKIIATLGVMRATHLEGAWIDPEHRGNLGVTRALVETAKEKARAFGDPWAFGGAADENMHWILERMGGVRMPMDLYALWIGREKCRQQ